MTTDPSAPDQPVAPSSELPLGASWYPELWPEDQWALDVARMKEVGVTVVRLFEYAWHRLEPREWEYDFEWANRVLNLLQENNLKAVVATPTAAPPVWLTSRYPEVLGTDIQGRRRHGGRHPYSVVSSRYREFCTRIVDQMVHSFRGHDAILAWQIDSAINGSEFGGEARRLFHVWLHERFGHIDQLNKAWGTEHWGQAYEHFDQVPGPRITGGAENPSLMLAYQRFINDQWAAFIQAQCETIRAGFDKPITLNMPCGSNQMNWFRLNHLIDRVGVTFDEAIQMPQMLPHFDRLRAEKPGVSYYLLGAPTDQNAHRLGWLAVLAGGDMVLFDHWRSNWAGREMGRGGVVSATGKWTAARAQIERLAKEAAQQGSWLEIHPPAEARLAIVASHESNWVYSIDPQRKDEFDLYRGVWFHEFYAPLAGAHYWRDVIDQTADFCPYHVILVPLLPMLFRPTRDRLKQWVEEGGHLLLGPHTGTRTEELTAWTDHEFGGLEELMGATWSHEIAPDSPINVADSNLTARAKGKSYALTPTTAKPLATYADNSAAATLNTLGQGTVLTLTTRLDAPAYLHLVKLLCDKANLAPLAAGSPQVAVLPAMNPDTTIAAYALINLSDQPQTITLPHEGKDRVTNKQLPAMISLPPREVMLIEIARPTPSPASAG